MDKPRAVRQRRGSSLSFVRWPLALILPHLLIHGGPQAEVQGVEVGRPLWQVQRRDACGGLGCHSSAALVAAGVVVLHDPPASANMWVLLLKSFPQGLGVHVFSRFPIPLALRDVPHWDLAVANGASHSCRLGARVLNQGGGGLGVAGRENSAP